MPGGHWPGDNRAAADGIEQRESESFIDRAWKAIKQKLQDLSSPTSEVAPA